MTEQIVKDLVEAQKQAEKKVQLLVKGLNGIRGEIGGLSRNVSYALENDTYRGLLKENYGIELKWEERICSLQGRQS